MCSNIEVEIIDELHSLRHIVKSECVQVRTSPLTLEKVHLSAGTKAGKKYRRIFCEGRNAKPNYRTCMHYEMTLVFLLLHP